jgi:hypothetical protein
MKDDISMKFEEEVILSEHLTRELGSKNQKLQFIHAKFDELEDKAAKMKKKMRIEKLMKNISKLVKK